METTEAVREAIQVGDWVASVERHVFSYPNQTVQPKVPEVYPQGRGISAPGSPLRDMHGPSNLHPRDEGGEGHAATKKR